MRTVVNRKWLRYKCRCNDVPAAGLTTIGGISVRIRSLLYVGLALIFAVVASSGLSQTGERQFRTGVKSSEPGYVTSLEVDVPVADADAAERLVSETYNLLREATLRAGFTPTGKARAVAKISTEGPLGATIRIALQLFVVEQPTDEDLKGGFDFELLHVDAEKVAYSFHKGSIRSAQATFMRLWQWTVAQGLDVNGYPCMVVYGLSDKAPDVFEVQLPVK